MKKKIYCFNNGESPGLLHAMAIAEDGKVLAGHCCSHEGFMRHDLGMDGSTWKHEHYNEHFGEGQWELEWVSDPMGHEGCAKAIEIANAEPEEEQEPEALRRAGEG